MEENNNGMNQQPTEYQQNVGPQYAGQQMPQETTSVGGWFLTILLTCIPCVGLIMLCIWGFGNTADKSKSNWAKAQLIWMIIGIIATIIFYVTVGAGLLALVEGY